MKKFKVLLIAVILLSAGSTFQQAAAQEKTKAEQEKEAKLQQAIDEQKKAMLDQKRVQDELDVIKKKQEAEMKDLIEVSVDAANDADGNYRVFTQRDGRPSSGTRTYSGSRSFSGSDPFIFASQGGGFSLHSYGGDTEGTTWDFSKSVKEKTFSCDYTFDVEKTVKSVIMSVMGDCKAGDIRIKIVMPNGKSYSDIVIDESGNLNWRKSFNITETENQDKSGEWKFQISSNKATGFFKISLQAF